MKWEKARFDTASQATVPRERGVYVFTLEFAGAKLPPHSYVLYVGIPGIRRVRISSVVTGSNLLANYKRALGRGPDDRRVGLPKRIGIA